MRLLWFGVPCGSALAMLVAGASCSSFGDEGPAGADASADTAGERAEAGVSDPDGGDGATGDASVRRLAVFVTAARSTGRLGDTAGGFAAYAWAKATCNEEGRDLRPGRTFEPGICLTPAGAGGPKPDLLERLVPDGEWYLPNGATPSVKRNNRGLQFLTRLDQRASGADVDTSVWTGCTDQGIAFIDRNCESWSSSSDASFGQVGYTHAPAPGAHLAATTDSCEKLYSLLCFEIP